MLDRTRQRKDNVCSDYLLRTVSKPVKITQFTKISSQNKCLRCVFLVLDHSPWSLSWYSRPDCSPEDLYTIELLKTANLQYNSIQIQISLFITFSFQFLYFASKILVRGEIVCIAAKHSLKAVRYYSALHKSSYLETFSLLPV